MISQFLWFNRHIKIDAESIYIYITKSSNKNLNFVGQSFKLSGNIKFWIKMERKFDLPEHLKFHWIQLINTIPKDWKRIYLRRQG